MRKLISAILIVIFAQVVSPRHLGAEIIVGTTSQISLSTSGGAPSDQSREPGIGGNGKHVVFSSGANNIVSDDVDFHADVFIKDLAGGGITRASVGAGGVAADGPSGFGAASPVLPDGFFAVAMVSSAKNIGSFPNPEGYNNIFIRLPTLDITELMSYDPQAQPSSGNNSYEPSLTVLRGSDGINQVLVAFTSNSGTLVVGDTNQVEDIFLARFKVPVTESYTLSDQLTIERISVASTPGAESDGRSGTPKISADGRYVVFTSAATNLTDDLPVGTTAQQVYRYDIIEKTTKLISRTADGEAADSDCYDPSISFNGRAILYRTTSENIVSNGNPEAAVLVLHDASKGSNRRVNESVDGVQGDASPTAQMLSPNGRLVAFADSSSNLVSADTNDRADIFVKDLETGKVLLVSVGPGGVQANQFSSDPILAGSFTGLTMNVGFASYSTNLTEPSTSGGLNQIYMNTVTLDPPVLAPGTMLEVPPEISIGAKKITVTAQKFGTSPVAASKQKIQYEFQIVAKGKVKGKSRTTRTTILSKRNTITTTKQKAATYKIRNRVRIVNTTTGKTVLKTGFTPRETFKTS